MSRFEQKPGSNLPPFFWAILFSVLGLFGNYIALPLGFDVNFIFGSIFGLLAVSLLGFSWGCLASFVAATYTLALWNHPYAIVIFTCESLWLGLALKRRPTSTLFLIDLAYWLCLGIPLVFLFYFGVMDLGMKSTATIALKQSLNGVCNAIVASFLLNALPFRRWLGIPPLPLRTNSQVFFEAMALLFLIPSIAGLIFMNQRDISRAQNILASRVIETALETEWIVGNWLENLKRATGHLVQVGLENAFKPSEKLQAEVSSIHLLFPDFHSVYIADGSATAVAFDPKVNERGESTVGMNFADRAYYKTLQETLLPVISDIFQGRGGTFKPIFTVSSPAILQGQLLGFALGAVNLEKMGQTLLRISKKSNISLTVIDRDRNIVVSTHAKRQSLKRFNLNIDGAQPSMMENVLLYLPEAHRNVSVMQSWKDAFFFTQVPIANTNWTLIAEGPLAPLQTDVYDSSIKNMIAIFLLLFATNGLSLWVSRFLGEPTKRLAELSSSIPEKLESGVEIDWPDPEILEVATLTDNFRQTAGVLREKLSTLKQNKESLETKVAERTLELQTSNEKLRIIFENEIYAICIFDVQTFEFVDINNAYLRIYGYSRDELLAGMTIRDITAEQDASVKASDQATRVGTTFIPLRYHRKKNGTVFPVEIVGGPYTWNGRRVMFALAHDISERLEAEKKLARMLREQEVILSTLTISVSFIKNRTVQWANAAHDLMFGYPPGETKGLPTATFFESRDLADDVFQRSSAAFRSGGTHFQELPLKRQDGTLFWCNLIGNPIDQNNLEEGSIWMIQDISERKRAEIQLKESERLFREAIEFMPIPLGIIRQDGTVRNLNKSFTMTFGYTCEDIPDLATWQRKAYPDATHRAEVAEQWSRDCSSVVGVNDPTPIREYGVTCKDGHIRHVEVTGQLIGTDQIVSLYDVTARKQAQELLHTQAEQLKDLSDNLELRVQTEIERRFKSEQLLIQQSKMAAMGEMLGAIAHQWRQPLNALGIILQNTRDAFAFGELDRPFLDKSVERSMAQIRHMSKTIDDFRDFFKPDKERGPFNTLSAIAGVIQLFSAQLEAGNITYRLICLTHKQTFSDCNQVVPCPGKVISGYKNEFEQVIMNLINNAREAIIDKRALEGEAFQGKILFDFSIDEAHVVITLSDNGGGISPEILSRVFDPYFTTKPTKGTGLGLYMSKIIIEDHMQGTLSATNGEHGAIFTIRLPRIEEHQNA